ncbi:MAG: hypothetical protein ACM30E_01020, partial [Nitrososphaerales archaeon]
DCVPKLHLGPVDSSAEVAADAAAGFGWCFSINTFPISSSAASVLSPLSAIAYCADLQDGTWAYVHADGDHVANNKSSW